VWLLRWLEAYNDKVDLASRNMVYTPNLVKIYQSVEIVLLEAETRT